MGIPFLNFENVQTDQADLKRGSEKGNDEKIVGEFGDFDWLVLNWDFGDYSF
jgi:hypothetical protein